MDELKSLDKTAIKLMHKHNVLYPLIKNIFYEKTLNEVSLTKTEIDNALESFWKFNGLNNEKNYLEWIKTNNFIKEEVDCKIVNDEKFNKLCIEKFDHKIESRFLKRKSELDLVVYSLIRIKDGFQAREIHLRLKEKESDFSDLASKYSEGVEKLTRGIIGPIEVNKAHPKIIEVLTSIKPGEIYKPIIVDNWYIILRLESIKRAFLDDDMKLQMAKELGTEWIKEQSKSIIKELLRINN